MQERKFKYFNRFIHKIFWFLKKISLPGFSKVPLFDVAKFFYRGLKRGSITTRASSIAFQLFLAALPALIFFFTLIPYIPVHDLKIEVFELLRDILPENVFLTIQETIEDLFVKRRSLQVFGFLVALFFATNGITSIIKAFNATYHSIDTRSGIARRLIAILLVFIITGLIVLSIILIILSKLVITKLVDAHIIMQDTGSLFIISSKFLINTGKWVVLLGLIFFAISFLYYLAPIRKTKWRLISPGSTLATILVIVTSLGFSYYVNNFGNFNKFFGSIGTLMVMMIWLNINAFSVLIGFELNVSISNARDNHESELKPQMNGIEDKEDSRNT